MSLLEKLFSNEFLRNMLASFGFRSTLFSRHDFTPFFQYRIGPYRPDHYLYFSREPFNERYYNEIFNKTIEYKGYGIVEYIEFHYNLYPDKAAFVRFLHYEASERLKRKHDRELQSGYCRMLKWTSEQLERQRAEEVKRTGDPAGLNGRDIEIRGVVGNDGNGAMGFVKVNEDWNSMNQRIETMVANAEAKLEDMTRGYDIGQIDLNNDNHLEKILQVFVLLRDLRAPKGGAKGEPLFRAMTNRDLACMMRLHFKAFSGKRNNTIEKEVAAAAEVIRSSHSEPIRQLEQALIAFIYGAQ
ncbi:hypothetical protein V9K67_09165 [Paraflavisolibacter sp. H34]|uniref:hypothetical protein n=1 Tax=Huijunlia imazamoxiresistens TaxID=3127457 RepID=UPI0030196C29